MLFAVFISASSGVPPARAQAPVEVGPHLGFNFDGDDVALGGQALIPVAAVIALYPSIDIYFPNTGTLLGFNVDLQYQFPTPGRWAPFLGGGLNILYRSVGSVSDSDLGLNLLGGVRNQAGPIRPFVEGRVLIHDNSSFQLAGGLNIPIRTRP